MGQLGAGRACSKPVVLIADDDPDVAQSYAEVLEVSGYRVCTACDGREVVARAVALRPDVILMDLDMPRMDGWEATRRIRADLRTHRIPILALTCHGLRRHRDRSFAAGCNAFLDKPCEVGELVAEIERALQRSTPLGAVVDVSGDVGSGVAFGPSLTPTPPARR